MNAEQLAEKFYDTYDKLAPEFYGANINKVSWNDLSNETRLLMVATFREIRKDLVSKDVAKKVLRIAIARGKLMVEILKLAEEFNCPPIVREIRKSKCMKKWIDHEENVKELKEETDEH